MRASLSLLIITAWMAAPIVRAQTAASQTAASQPAASRSAMTRQTAVQPNEGQPAAAPLRGPGAAHPSRRSPSRQARLHRATAAATARRRAASDKAGGVLSLGATDITGNKELPKVMVIVPWKDSLGAGGVVKPTDSLLDEVLTPVDRGVFQRQVRYYEQIDGPGKRSPAGGPAGRVAPVGDNR